MTSFARMNQSLRRLPPKSRIMGLPCRWSKQFGQNCLGTIVSTQKLTPGFAMFSTAARLRRTRVGPAIKADNPTKCIASVGAIKYQMFRTTTQLAWLGQGSKAASVLGSVDLDMNISRTDCTKNCQQCGPCACPGQYAIITEIVAAGFSGTYTDFNNSFFDFSLFNGTYYLCNSGRLLSSPSKPGPNCGDYEDDTKFVAFVGNTHPQVTVTLQGAATEDLEFLISAFNVPFTGGTGNQRVRYGLQQRKATCGGADVILVLADLGKAASAPATITVQKKVVTRDCSSIFHFIAGPLGSIPVLNTGLQTWLTVYQTGARLVFGSVVNPGAGYAVGDTITVAGGKIVAAAIVTVDSVTTSGMITSAHISTNGQYLSPAVNDLYGQNSTSGSGSGAIFFLPSPGLWEGGATTGIDSFPGRAGMVAGRMTVDVVRAFGLSFSSIVNGGTGYAANDTITLKEGRFTTACVMVVDTVSGGVIQTAHVQSAGSYQKANDTGQYTQSSTSGSGTGAIFFMFSKDTGAGTYTLQLYEDLPGYLAGTASVNATYTAPVSGWAYGGWFTGGAPPDNTLTLQSQSSTLTYPATLPVKSYDHA